MFEIDNFEMEFIVHFICFNRYKILQYYKHVTIPIFKKFNEKTKHPTKKLNKLSI